MLQESKYSNVAVAKILRSVAAAKLLKKRNIFEIRAYENAADSIEHSTAEVKDLWGEGKLDFIPGLGKGLQKYLDEYFKSGKLIHFEAEMKGLKPVLFEMLDINGVGPKTAFELTKLGIKSLKELEDALNNGSLYKKGFSEKIGQKILEGLGENSKKTGRVILPYASAQAEKILKYLKLCKDVVFADPLGSLRRKVATIGDLDFAVGSNNPEAVVDHFVKMPGVSRILDKGESKANIILESGLEVDLLVGKPESYGALLQHFTGSKNHNIKLRNLALEKGLSLSEYGVKKRVKGEGSRVKEEIISCKSEDELYKLLGMDTPPPEIREDSGEIEAALRQAQGKFPGLPKLVEPRDIKGDLHLHSNFPMVSPSHGPGLDSIENIVKRAIKLGYEYVGISDHPPGFRTVPENKMVKILESRSAKIDKIKKSTNNIRVLNGLEIDILPDGTLSIPNYILKTLDYCIAGIHYGHRGSSEDITKRILAALENPYVDIIAHPTGRLLNERESSEADWEKIFKYCAEHKKLLEINAYPNRLDLRDDLVRQALKFGCKFIINTDAHEVLQMEVMPYGVSVARRGWVEAKDVANTWDWKKFAEWFQISD